VAMVITKSSIVSEKGTFESYSIRWILHSVKTPLSH
jgi:hypothetical protein